MLIDKSYSKLNNLSQNQGFLAAKIKNHQNPNKWQIHNKYSHNSFIFYKLVNIS